MMFRASEKSSNQLISTNELKTDYPFDHELYNFDIFFTRIIFQFMKKKTQIFSLKWLNVILNIYEYPLELSVNFNI